MEPVYAGMSRQQLLEEQKQLNDTYQSFVAQNLSLNMARGKPGSEQLALSMPMLSLSPDSLTKAGDGSDTRNYGDMDGIPELKEIFAGVLGVGAEQLILGGCSSLNLMYDLVVKALLLGTLGGGKPWGRQGEIKFLCPAPGYDRHFAICEEFGIEMIPVAMRADGPDMDFIEKAVSSDESIKGIWCVPKFSNPQGITYSDAVVRRFAALSPKADDFRIFWDNAYCVHSIDDQGAALADILAACKESGKPHMVYEFFSTSKITFAGAGVAAVAASVENIAFLKKQFSVQTIGFDKINQARHARFFGSAQGLVDHMKKHAAILNPKFSAVLDTFERELAGLRLGSWTRPHGGYFISYDAPEGCAKRIVSLCKAAGVILTGAGATYPYGKDPLDSNIRIAPTFPPVQEVQKAMELFCLCARLAAVEKYLEEK